MTDKSKNLSCDIQNLHLTGFRVSNAGEEAAFHQVVDELNRGIIRVNKGEPIKIFESTDIKIVIAIAISLLVEKTAGPRQLDDRMQKLINECDDILEEGF